MGTLRRRFTGALVTLVVVTLMAAGITPGSQPLAAQESTAVRPDRWMGDLAPYLQDKKLTDIVIPGTHDSAAYWVDENGPMLPGHLPDAIMDIYNEQRVGGQFMARFALAQSRTIKEQLEDGIRYLDIRLAKYNGEIYAHHGLVGHKADVIFDDIEEFVKTSGREKEIVILSVSFLGNTPAEDVQSYRQAILDRFTDRVVPLTRQWNDTDGWLNDPIPPIGELWNAGQQVVFLGPAKTGEVEPGLWIDSPWPNKWQEQELENAVAENLRNGPSDQIYTYTATPPILKVGLNAQDRLFVLQPQPTPDAMLIALNLFDPFYVIAQCFNFNCIASLEALAKGTGKRMLDKVFDWWLFNHNNARANLNIVIADFYENTSLVQSALNFNQPFGITPSVSKVFGRPGELLKVPLAIVNPTGVEYIVRASQGHGIVVKMFGNGSPYWEWSHMFGDLATSPGNYTVTLTATTVEGNPTVLGTATIDVSRVAPPANGTVILWPAMGYQAPAGTAPQTFSYGSHAAIAAGPVGSVMVASDAVAVLHSCENFGNGYNASYRTYENDDVDLADDPWAPGYCGGNVAKDNVKALWVLKKNCQPGPLEVALFDQPNFQGGCALVGIGTVDNPRDAGFPNDFVGSVRVGAHVSFEWWDAAFQSGTGGMLGPGAAAATLTYASGAPGLDVLSSLRVLSTDAAPPITGAEVTPQPNSTVEVGGVPYYRRPVTVTLAATDGGVGVDKTYYSVLGSGVSTEYTGPFVLSQEGAVELGYWSVDLAGNLELMKMTTVRQDFTDPTTTATLAGQRLPNGDYTGAVTVTLHSTDNFSGPGIPSWGLDGGLTQPYSGPFQVTAPGAHVLRFVNRDLAGNLEATRSISFTIETPDTTPPTIDVVVTPDANAAGWHRQPVTVTWSVNDNVGVHTTSGCEAVTVSADTNGATYTCEASDAAGNAAVPRAVTIRLDQQKPVVTFGAQAPAANAQGWNRTDVTMPYSIADAGSGLPEGAPASGELMFTSEGEALVQSVSAVDVAGNEVSVSSPAVNLDKTAPVVTVPSLVEAPALSANGGPASFAATASDALQGALTPDCTPSSGSVFPLGSSAVQCRATDRAGNTGTASFTVTVADVTPPQVTLSVQPTWEATGPAGAVVQFAWQAADAVDAAPQVTCTPGSGATLPIGQTVVRCAVRDAAGNTNEAASVVSVLDRIAPAFAVADMSVVAPAPNGAAVTLPATATDAVAGEVPVTCLPASSSVFPIGTTPVSCTATDAYGNSNSQTFSVTVVEPTSACFVVDFREITYFKHRDVITSSDDAIRAGNQIAGPFDPSLWPYRASGGSRYTRSRGTLFRIYGFTPSQLGRRVPNADDPSVSYLVQRDDSIAGGAYYVDLGGPARVSICPEQLHNYVLAGEKGNGHMAGSARLPEAQRNVPGVMLTHNTQILKLPKRVRSELRSLGLPSGDRGVVDYVGFQIQGQGNDDYREFVDVELSFPFDSEPDRARHYQYGFHTATNINFESYAGCNYVDHAPGNDSVRLQELWSPNRSIFSDVASGEACGRREPRVNQSRRADYEVPFNAIQLLPTVSSGTDTNRIFFGPIRAVTGKDEHGKDHKKDWRDWDDWDRDDDTRRTGKRRD